MTVKMRNLKKKERAWSLAQAPSISFQQCNTPLCALFLNRGFLRSTVTVGKRQKRGAFYSSLSPDYRLIIFQPR